MQLVGDDHPLDHVADDRRPRTTLQLNGHHGAVVDAAQRPIDAGDARWAAEAGCHQTSTTNLATDGARRVGKVEGRVVDRHGITVAQGCHTEAGASFSM